MQVCMYVCTVCMYMCMCVFMQLYKNYVWANICRPTLV